MPINGTIVALRDKFNNNVFPETSSQAVYMDNGKTLEELSDEAIFFGENTDVVQLQKPEVIEKINNIATELESIQYKTIIPEMFGAIGNGIVDDTKAIQDALDYLKHGGILELTRGKIYKVTYTLLVNNNTKIIGYGSKILFEANHQDSVLFAHKLFNSETEWGTNCIFEGFEFETSTDKGNGIAACRIDGLTIKNITGKYVFWHILDLTHCKNVIVENVNGISKNASIQFDTLSESGGIVVTGIDAVPILPSVKTDVTENILVFGCRLKSLEHAGFHFHRDNGNGVTIKDSVIYDSIYAIYGDKNCNWNNINIINNTLENCNSMIEFNGYYNDVIIDSNKIKGIAGVTNRGIAFASASNSILKNNYTNNLKITNNTIQDTNSSPIDLFENVIIYGNTFINCGFDPSSNSPGQFVNYYALGLAQCKNVNIENNIFKDCKYGCIRFYSLSSVLTSGSINVNIIGNIATNCHNFITNIQGNTLINENINVKNNNIRTSSTAGHIINPMYWKNSCIEGNYIEQSGKYSIAIDYSTNVDIKNNTINVINELSEAYGISFNNSTGSSKRNSINGFTKSTNYEFRVLNTSTVDVDEQYGGYIDSTSGGFWIFVHKTKPQTTRLTVGSYCTTKDLSQGYLGFIYTSNGWKGYGQLQS